METQIVGTLLPILNVTLQPGEAVFAESGELSWMSPTINMTTSSQFGGGGGGIGVLKRAVGGSSIFMTEYKADQGAGTVSFAAKLPGQIFPVDVSSQPGQTYLCHRHGFVCAPHGVELSVGFQQKFTTGFFGGDGFRLQKITGQGQAWIELGGEVVVFDLGPGEMLRVHPGHVGLFQDTVNFGITTIKGIKNKIFGGDGVFLAQMTGPGRVWLQSLPFPRLAQALSEYTAGAAAGAATGGVAGGLLGGILRG